METKKKAKKLTKRPDLTQRKLKKLEDAQLETSLDKVDAVEEAMSLRAELLGKVKPRPRQQVK
jgi:hypothetical protein